MHAPVFARWQADDAEVRDLVEQLVKDAITGREALLLRDRETFLRCCDRNFDLRASVFPIAAADQRLIDLGRSLGAAAKLPGSGGAVLFVCRDDAQQQQVAAAAAAATSSATATATEATNAQLRLRDDA